MPKNRKAETKAGEKVNSTDLAAGVNRVIGKGSLAELARKVGCSVPTLSAWRKGKTQLSLKDAISMGLLDTKDPQSEYERVVSWVKLCGHGGRLDDPKLDLASEIRKRTSLAARLDEALINLSSLAGLDGKPVDPKDFLLALSCYLGQTRLKQDVEEWKKSSNGQGTMAFIWRWNDETCRLLRSKAVKLFVQSLIQQPPLEITRGWMPPTRNSQIGVSIYIQINLKAGALNLAMINLASAVADFLDDVRLNREEKSRFNIFTTTSVYRHPADCCVFASPPPGKTFAVLVTEDTELVKAVGEYSDPEVRANPYLWGGQLIHLNNTAVLANDCLSECSLQLNDGRLTQDKTWKEFVLSPQATTRRQ